MKRALPLEAKWASTATEGLIPVEITRVDDQFAYTYGGKRYRLADTSFYHHKPR